MAVPSYPAIPQQDGPAQGNGTVEADDGENEDDFFVLPMSPRSPEMKKSPFSLL
jgi:hypothetical protein